MEHKVTQLKEEFIDKLREDLQDTEKANPGLYKVIRETLKDLQADLDSIPKDSLAEIDTAPFKMPVSATG